jgi:hypothetical protein
MAALRICEVLHPELAGGTPDARPQQLPTGGEEATVPLAGDLVAMFVLSSLAGRLVPRA